MRSDDPSPWATEAGTFDEMEPESTASLNAQHEEEVRQRILRDRQEAALWERFAPRLTQNGGIVR